jgi:hypothetical protein
MSINKLISIKHPIEAAMESLSIDHDKFIPLFTKLAFEAENEIGSFYQYEVKRTVLDIKGCVACLPEDAVYLQTAILGDYGCDCSDLMNGVIAGFNKPSSYGGAANTFLVVDIAGTDGVIRGFINHQIQNNKIIFENNYDGQKVTIQYLAYKKDCDGFMEISQNHVLAIKWYIIWQYFFRKSNLTGYDYGKMNKAELEWHRECAHARAQDSEMTESTRRTVVGMLHNPYIGYSLENGLYTTLGNSINIW